MDKFTVAVTLPASGCTREDFYNMVRTLIPTAELVDDESIGVTDGKIGAKGRVGRWRKFSFTYEDFTAAGLSESITALSLAAGGVIHHSIIDVTEAFVIAGMSTLDFELGVTGDTDRYSGSTHIDGEAIGSAMHNTADGFGLESMSAESNILLRATSDAGNLNTATAGAVDVYVFYSNVINS